MTECKESLMIMNSKCSKRQQRLMNFRRNSKRSMINRGKVKSKRESIQLLIARCGLISMLVAVLVVVEDLVLLTHLGRWEVKDRELVAVE